ncbi:glucose 1-dehydrogenase [Nocardioides sp. YIM 152315]|uniref:SDR family NAD(P)-dependent oxidoreductase n=1 Tax=Nocardioides sp. YIM 152315 TaxID=3031760 RepID=UPI0023DAAF23|nr:glucose 1-dehydrogenase [Nocardioides sp. YIM 152315]MDF1602236.1 glucose 1-dehydrogenase [Nocardioides sp. YIM 152315]
MTVAIDLGGKVAVITGGSRGLGREMAQAYAAAGAHVVVASRKQDACDAAAAEITESTGVKAVGVAAHVGDWDGCSQLVDATIDAFGKIDVLINNAGIAPAYDSIESVTEALFDKTFDVNLKGPFRLASVAAPRMEEGGAIINVSSIASVRPKESDLVYAAAKAGLNTITKALAQAYGPRLRVNTIMAGPFLTEISEAWYTDAWRERARSFPLGRAGRPDEISGTALYFGSDLSTFTTGTVLAVDGGRTAMS